MNTDRAAQPEWEPCPPGTLTGLASDLHRRHRRKQLGQWAGVVCVLLVVVSAGWYVVHSIGHPSEFNYGGIACSEVHQALPDFMVQRVSEDLERRIQAHLAKCAHCQELMQKMVPPGRPQVSTMVPPPCAYCGRAHDPPYASDLSAFVRTENERCATHATAATGLPVVLGSSLVAKIGKNVSAGYGKPL